LGATVLARFFEIRLVRILFSTIHGGLLRLTRGRLPGSTNFLVLTTTGRKSGKQRRVPLIFVEDDGKYAIVASRAGSDAPPVWWLNLQAEPNASIEIRGTSTAVAAAEASQADHDRLWPELTAIYPTYDDYVKRTERRIPVVLLTPHGQ
jgi:deazaflavin-dependent oxidoreductase (nitroreductase family)